MIEDNEAPSLLQRMHFNAVSDTLCSLNTHPMVWMCPPKKTHDFGSLFSQIQWYSEVELLEGTGIRWGHEAKALVLALVAL
jgi:hypothetical protein